MEDSDIPAAVLVAQAKGAQLDPDDVTYFLGRETLIVTSQQGMAVWREKLFVVMARKCGACDRIFSPAARARCGTRGAGRNVNAARRCSRGLSAPRIACRADWPSGR